MKELDKGDKGVNLVLLLKNQFDLDFLLNSMTNVYNLITSSIVRNHSCFEHTPYMSSP